MQQALKENLTVFPVPGREEEMARKIEAAQEAIRKEAFAAGFAAGEAEAQQQFAAQESTLEQVGGQLLEQVSAATDAIEQSHRKALLALLQAALPALARSAAAEEILSIVLQTLSGHLEGRLDIIAGSALAAQLEPHIARIGAPERLALAIDETREETNVGLAWQGGAAEIDLQATIDRCLQVLTGPDAPEAGE